MTVLDLLKENNLSNKIIKSLKSKGHIQKDGKIIYLAKEIKEGDFVTLIFESLESNITPVKIDFDIVYKTDDMMVIDKPYGLSVMSTLNLKEDTLLNAIEYYLEENNIESKIHIVNRLDRNTTGLMVVAFNRLAASILNDSLKDTLKRKYYCIVRGILDKKEDTITNLIAKESSMSVRRCIRNDGKEAITNYKVIKEFNGYSLLEVELKTGRTHQIRVTFASLGHPLINDEFYDPYYEGKGRIMLHSHCIEFIDPTTKEKMNFDIGLTDEMKEFINNSN